ncbi:MAG: hypothetical protein LBQ55_07620, partial [Treponema sp.]|nr:hypothetical protein [Treponema sp.]
MTEQHIGEPERQFTYEQLWNMFQENARIIRETGLQLKETDRYLQETTQEHDRRLRESDLQLKESNREFREALRENDREFREALRENVRELKDEMKKTEQELGRLGNRFGSMVEHLVAPNLLEKFNRLGYAFTRISSNIRIRRPDNSVRTQIDLLLENGDYAMAVEIKAHLTTEDIQEHRERIERVREYADDHDDRRRYLGAVAGAIVDDGVRDYALKTGFFVIKQSG